MIEKITTEIIEELKTTAPNLTSKQLEWRNRIINSDNPKFFGYGHTISEIEKIIKLIYNKYPSSYEDAINIFKNLASSNVIEEKFAGIFFLNHFKKSFNKETIDLFEEPLSKYWLLLLDTVNFLENKCTK